MLQILLLFLLLLLFLGPPLLIHLLPPNCFLLPLALHLVRPSNHHAGLCWPVSLHGQHELQFYHRNLLLLPAATVEQVSSSLTALTGGLQAGDDLVGAGGDREDIVQLLQELLPVRPAAFLPGHPRKSSPGHLHESQYKQEIYKEQGTFSEIKGEGQVRKNPVK